MTKRWLQKLFLITMASMNQKCSQEAYLGYRHMGFAVFHLQLYWLINIRIQSYFDFVQLYEFDLKVFLSNLHHWTKHLDKHTDELYVSHRSPVKRKNVKVKVWYLGTYFLRRVETSYRTLPKASNICSLGVTDSDVHWSVSLSLKVYQSSLMMTQN